MATEPEDLEQTAPVGHARVVYMGPVAPHWEIHSDFGDRQVIDDFRQRVQARLLLLPPHDPQFRRNRERVARDAEREHLLLEWDLGIPEEDELIEHSAAAPAEPPAATGEAEPSGEADPPSGDDAGS